MASPPLRLGRAQGECGSSPSRRPRPRSRAIGVRVASAALTALAVLAPVEKLMVVPVEGAKEGVLRVGGALSSTGKFATASGNARNGALLWKEKVDAAGGISLPNGEKLRVELVLEDDESDKAKAVEIVTQMLDNDEMDVVLGPYSSGFSLAVSEVTEAKKRLILVHGGASDTIFARDYKHLVGTYTPASLYMASGLRALRGAGAKTVAIAYEDKAFAQVACEAASTLALELGFEVKKKHVFPVGDLDFQPMVGELVDLGFDDVLVACGHFSDAVMLAMTAKTMSLRAKAVLVTGCADQAFIEAVGPTNAEHFLGPVQWYHTMSYQDPFFGTAKEYNEAYEKRFGKPSTYHSASASAALYALQRALETSGVPEAGWASLETAERLKALDEVSFYGHLKFGANGAIDGKPMATIQVQSGALQVVVPGEAAAPGISLAYPMAAWVSVKDQVAKQGASADEVLQGTPVVEMEQLAEGWIRAARNTVERSFQDVVKSDEGYGDCPHFRACSTCTCPEAASLPAAVDAEMRASVKWPFEVSYKVPAARLPETTDATSKEASDAICLARKNGPLARKWKEQWEEIGKVEQVGYWMYGDQASGLLGIWPGAESCNEKYDPRFRPWYSAAVSGPKDVVVVIDTSGSMSNMGRMQIAIDAVTKVLDTLVDNDYATVVRFSGGDMVEAYKDADNSELLQPMTAENKKAIQDWVAELYPAGKTNYEAALKKAFLTIENSRKEGRSSRCNALVLMMSDGDVTEGKKDNELLAHVKKINHADIAAKIFTYSFGTDVSQTTLKRIACQSQGIWYSIPDGGDLGAAMAGYYVYFAATSDVDRVKWYQYTFSSTGKVGISGCLPVYDNTAGRVKQLFGVTCVDMNVFANVEELMERKDFGIFAKKMAADSKKCPLLNLDPSSLQKIRKTSSSPQAVCTSDDYEAGRGDNSPAEDGGSGSPDPEKTADDAASEGNRRTSFCAAFLLPGILAALLLRPLLDAP